MGGRLSGMEDVLRRELEKRTPLSELERKMKTRCSTIYKWITEKLDFDEHSEVYEHYKVQFEKMEKERYREKNRKYYEENYKKFSYRANRNRSDRL